MNDFFYLIPIALGLGVAGLAAFMWTLRSGQYDDLDGAAARILLDENDKPIVNVNAADPPATDQAAGRDSAAEPGRRP